jgi:hypothetical protein
MSDDLTEYDTALEEQPRDEAKLREVHARALRRFEECASATREQREKSLEARRFVSIPGAQWEGPWGDQFEQSIKVEVNKVARALRKIETDYRANRVIPDFRPDGKEADQSTADMLDGLHRADSYRFKSQQARDNACFEAFSGGFGAYRLTNEWDDEDDPQNDYQRVNPAAIVVDADQSVFFDIAARLYDKADARFAFLRAEYTREGYEEEFDQSPSDFPEGVPHKLRDWFRPETVAVAEYYEREDSRETLLILTNPVSKEERRIWQNTLDRGAIAGFKADGWQVRKQVRKRSRVHKYILSGAEVLKDCGYIIGSRIPIVPVYGQRYFIDGVERWKGCVQDKMDPQRLYNSNVSKLAETNSLSPREIPIFAADQMPPHLADKWARMNIDRHPYALIEPLRDETGAMVAMGPVGKVEPPNVPPVLAALIQISNQDVQEDLEDGADTVKANTSAEAMDIAATRVDAKSAIYLDNVRQSVQCEGEIYLGMACEVYVEEGREVETMTEDGNYGNETLKVMRTDKTGTAAQANDLERGRYKVLASVTEATATRRDKTVRTMLQTAEVAVTAGDQELAQAALITAVANQDGEGTDEFKAWNRKRGLGMGLFEPSKEEAEEIKAQQEAAGQEVDPMAELAQAQSADFIASAQKKQVEAVKVAADTELAKAKTVETLTGLGRPANDPGDPAWQGSLLRRQG